MTTRSKALRARTIVPDDLYVDRDADRQLNEVIDEMGRPGYILVARQMGKTNLLLRMKRRREAHGELAVYIDLSIGFSDARGLFRHLIDSLLEALPIDHVRLAIDSDRNGTEVDASVEYDRHLRRVLTASGKERVIIILDEIDSLVGQSYSDRILSQVRSMYFARANHAIYERLTYVLSGVAEPTDLIKDKNISPFNIGEKIYLNDFSRSEVSTLLKKAQIRFDLDVQEAVYGWTSGNPRMTWDVYSALEDVASSSEVLDATSVDAVIQKLYLTRYDRAPLDHIRALAENDPEVRTALVALLYGKGETLDDRARSKLYLAGITTASANASPAIKNRVIEHALSETWLAQVEAGQKGLLTAAGRRYTSGAYSEAIELFRQYLSSGGTVDTFDEIEMLQYGMVLYHAAEYHDAAVVLDLAARQSRSVEVRSMLNYHKGLSVMMVGRVDEAIEILTVLSTAAGPYTLRSKHALGTAYLKKSISQYYQKIIGINEDVISQAPDDDNLQEDEKCEVISAAYYNIGQVYATQGRDVEAKQAYEAANDAAAPRMKPAFASVRLQQAENDEEYGAILTEVSEILIDEDVPYSKARGMLGFDESDMAKLLSIAIKLKRPEVFESLLEIAQRRSDAGRFETIFSLATSMDWQTDSFQLRTLLRHALTDSETVRQSLLKQKLNAAAIWLARSDDSDEDAAFEVYWRLVREPEALEYLSANDTIALANRVGKELNRGNIEAAKRIMNFVRRNQVSLSEKSAAMFAFFVYQEMVVHRLEDDYDRSIQAAREILSLVSPTSTIGDVNALQYSSLIDRLKQAATKEIEQRSISRPKFGRNEFVSVIDPKTGVRTRIKYKKVEDKIATGDLQISNEDDNSSLFIRKS